MSGVSGAGAHARIGVGDPASRGKGRAPTVSVVIPVHNRPALLKRAVASALDQSHSVFEILIIDDASSDETLEVAEILAAEEPRVRVLRQLTNEGACAARNRGIREAEGALIAFLDSDDRWERQKTARQLAALEAEPLAIGCFTGARHMAGERELAVRLPPACVEAVDLDAANVLGSTSCALVSRSALLDVGLFDPSMVSCQDWDLYLRLVRRGRLVTVREPLILYDVGEHFRISRNFDAVLEGHRAIARKVVAAQACPQEAERLRSLHAFKEADLTATVGGNRPAAIAYGLKTLIRDRRPRGALLFLRLLYRAAKSALAAR